MPQSKFTYGCGELLPGTGIFNFPDDIPPPITNVPEPPTGPRDPIDDGVIIVDPRDSEIEGPGTGTGGGDTGPPIGPPTGGTGGGDGPTTGEGPGNNSFCIPKSYSEEIILNDPNAAGSLTDPYFRETIRTYSQECTLVDTEAGESKTGKYPADFFIFISAAGNANTTITIEGEHGTLCQPFESCPDVVIKKLEILSENPNPPEPATFFNCVVIGQGTESEFTAGITGEKTGSVTTTTYTFDQKCFEFEEGDNVGDANSGAYEEKLQQVLAEQTANPFDPETGGIEVEYDDSSKNIDCDCEEATQEEDSCPDLIIIKKETVYDDEPPPPPPDSCNCIVQGSPNFEQTLVSVFTNPPGKVYENKWTFKQECNVVPEGEDPGSQNDIDWPDKILEVTENYTNSGVSNTGDPIGPQAKEGEGYEAPVF